jgi:hypothetical protein
MGKRHVATSAWGLTAILTSAIVLQGCSGLFPASSRTEYTIEVVGVIASERLGPERPVGTLFETFSDGRTYSLPNDFLLLGGVSPHVGDLFIAGSKPEPWVVGASLQRPDQGWPAGCYSLIGGGINHETTLELDVGITVPKAPNYHPIPGLGRHWVGALCLDRQGRAMEIFPSAS